MNKVSKVLIGLMVSGVFISGCKTNSTDSFSASNISKEETIKAIEENFKKGKVELKGLEVHETEIPSLYRLTAEGHPDAYVTKDGKYIISGMILNVSAERPYEVNTKAKADSNAKALKNADQKHFTVLKAEGKEATHLNVFFDPLCPYCKMFYSEIPAINKLGVTVNLIPLANTDEQKAVAKNVACSADKVDAMTKTVAGQDIEESNCEINFEDFAKLSSEVEATGTPSIYTEDGIKIGGMINAEQVKSILTDLKLIKETTLEQDGKSASEAN